MNASMTSSSVFQSVMKVLLHEFIFRPFRNVGKDEIALFETARNDPTLVA